MNMMLKHAHTRSHTLTPDTQQPLYLLHMHVHVHEDLTLQNVCPWNYQCLYVFWVRNFGVNASIRERKKEKDANRTPKSERERGAVA